MTALRYSSVATAIVVCAAAWAQDRPVTPPAATDALLPRRVTLRAHEASLRTAIEQLNRQTGWQFQFQGEIDLDKPQTLDIQDKPLWEAVDSMLSLASASSVILSDPASGYSFHLFGPHVHEGPFLVTAWRVSRTVHLDKDSANATLQLFMQVVTDGSCRLTSLPLRPLPTKVEGSNGVSFLPKNPLPESRISLGSSSPLSTYSMAIELDPTLAVSGSSIALLEGTIAANVLRTEEIELPFGKTIERETPGVKMKISLSDELPPDAPPMGPIPQGTSIAVAIHYVRDPAMSSERWSVIRSALWSIQPRVAGDLGQWRPGPRYSSPPTMDDGWVIFRLIRPSGPTATQAAEPPKVLFSLPLASQMVQIPYHLVNIPLP